ncbi:N-acetylmuramoyl-L-alanine amidase family protein [Treponema endosymbiont of Eucomonympha sp.]|uniref:N-acetylmuramoyl-L-alanine amidase family protein n=2 Tax=Treponema endosymbiont of Eucomonympha sp. TaxID=1580831 RepID=UPI00078601E6|nr:N-acetylmuramoyl-L-alanine amidase [Treponema endosymbiont of Eucomonympha sp.]
MKTAVRPSLAVLFSALCLTLSAAPASAAAVSLTEAAEKNGALLYWDALTGSGMLEKNGHRLSFRCGDALALLDSARLALVDPPRAESGSVLVSEAFLSAAAELFALPPSALPLYRIGAVLIDPGHGGKDTGCRGYVTVNGQKTIVYEKDIALSVSRLLYARLKAAYPDKNILMTRSDDTYLSLEERVELANSVPLGANEAIIYISVHVNSSLNSSASGFEVWYLSPDHARAKPVLSQSAVEDKELFAILNSMTEEEYMKESTLVAKFLLDALKAEIGRESPVRGIKGETFFVVRNANMPSVLAEIGFLSNTREAKRLRDPKYLQKIAQGLHSGLAAFIQHFEQSRGFTAR